MVAMTQTELQYRHRRTLKGTLSNKLQSSKKRAKASNMAHNLDLAYVTQLWEEQGGRCAKTGVEMGRIGDKWLSPSIDRIDPKEGYLKGNVQWTCWRYNDAKSDMSDESFTALCLAVAATHFKSLEGAETIRKEYASSEVEAPSPQETEVKI